MASILTILRTVASKPFRMEVQKKCKSYFKSFLSILSIVTFFWMIMMALFQYRLNSTQSVAKNLYNDLQSTYSKINHYKNIKHETSLLCDFGKKLSEKDKEKNKYYEVLDYYIKQTISSRAAVFSTTNKIADIFGDDIAADILEITNADLDVIPLATLYCQQKRIKIKKIDELERKSYMLAYHHFPHLNDHINSLRNSGKHGKYSISAINH